MFLLCSIRLDLSLFSLLPPPLFLSCISLLLLLSLPPSLVFFFFFFNDPAPPEIYPLPLHDALPILSVSARAMRSIERRRAMLRRSATRPSQRQTTPTSTRTACSSRESSIVQSYCSTASRSEEHTSELQSLAYLVCRLLLEKKKTDIPDRLADYILETRAVAYHLRSRQIQPSTTLPESSTRCQASMLVHLCATPVSAAPRTS